MQQITLSISETHPSLAGHFPGNPIVPAVVLLDELLGRVSGLHPDLHIRRLKQVKFMQPTLPGDLIKVHLSSTVAAVRFQAYREDDLVFSGELDCEVVVQ